MDEKEKGTKESPEKAKTQTKVQNKRFLWIVGGCCGCLIILIILAVVSSGFWGWRSGADIPIPSSIPASSSPTSYPTTNQTSYPEAQTCSQIETPPASPQSLSTDNPGLQKNVDIYYYKIYGYTANQLRAQIHACGPKDETGTWGAYTAYNINWRYDYDDTGAGCGIKNVTVGLQVDMYLPDWQKSENFAAGLDESWSTYISALTTHENGHRDYDVDGAGKILNTLSNLGSYNTCTEVGDAADIKGYEILDEIKALNESYDTSTNHGSTQGAVLE